MGTVVRLTASLLVTVGALCVSLPVRADLVAYGSVVDLMVTQGNLRAEHHHDWSKREAFVRLLSLDTGKEILRIDSPPLTTLWISPEGRYVVGLGQIKLDNPDQIFIASRDGSYVHRESMRCSDARIRESACMESVSNHVKWYDDTNPELHLSERGGRPAEISVNAFRPSRCDWPTPPRDGPMIEACLRGLPQLVVVLDGGR